MILVLIFGVGCQRKDRKIARQDEVELLALAEIDIPTEDNIIEVKKDVFIVEESEDRHEWVAENRLKVIDEDGQDTLVARNVQAWEVINKKGEDIIYYSDTEIYKIDIPMGTSKEYRTDNRSLKTYNIQTGKFDTLYTIEGDGYVMFLKDERTNKYFAALMKYCGQKWESNAELMLINLENDQVIFEQKSKPVTGSMCVYNNILYYGQVEPTSLLHKSTQELCEYLSYECMSTIMSYDISSQAKATFFDPMGYYQEKIGVNCWIGISCGIYLINGDNIYVAVSSKGPDSDKTTSEGIYEVSTKLGTIKEFIKPDEEYGWVTKRFFEGEFIYSVVADHGGRRRLKALEINNIQEYILGSICLGRDDKNFYVYDCGPDPSSNWENYFIKIFDEYNIIKSPEEIFTDISRLYRIPVGGIERENILLDEIKPYLDYQLINENMCSVIDDYMNPTIREGYISKPFMHNKYGLYKQDEESPFYETNDYIMRFEKAAISTIEQLNIDFEEDALTLDSGTNQKINWSVDNSDATVYFTSSNPSVATITQEGLIKAHNAGTSNIGITAIKNGFKRDIQNMHVTVVGAQKTPLVIKPSIIIAKPGEKVKVQYQIMQNSDLVISSENDDLEILQYGGNYIELTVPKEGESEVVFTVNKEGYKKNEIVVPIVRESDNVEEMITYLTKPWYNISDSQKNLESVRDIIANQSDIIGGELASLVRNPKKHIFKITKDDCTELVTRTWNIKQMLKRHMNQVRIIPDRQFANSLKINLEKVNDGVTIEINKNELEAVEEELMALTLNIKDLDVSIGIPLQHWKEILGDKEKLLIHLEKEDNGIRLSLEDEEARKVAKLPYNIEITLHEGILKNPQKTGLLMKHKGDQINLGGHYDEAEKGVKAGINKGGLIQPVEKDVIYSDILSLDNKTQDAIRKLGNMGLIDSEGEANKEHFRPDDILTRAEFTSIIVKVFYLLDKNLETNFSDIEKAQWYYDYIACGEFYSIIEGFPDGTFKPDDMITKEQMLAILARWLRNEKGYKPVTSVATYINHFKDKEDISQWAVEDVALSLREQMITVSEDNLLKPREGIKRSSAALVLNKMLEKLHQ